MIELAKKEPVSVVVEAARELLKRAESGEISFFVAFSKAGNESIFQEAGDIDARDVFFMTECWRHGYLRGTHEEWERARR